MDRLTGHAATGGHEDPGDSRGESLDVDGTKRRGRQAVANLLDRGRLFELLERCARRKPHRETPVSHGGQRIGRPQPHMSHDLAAFERGLRAARHEPREEPGIKAACEADRRDPARQRDEKIGPEPHVERFGDVMKRRVASDEGTPRLADLGVVSARVGEENACLFEELADSRRCTPPGPGPRQRRHRARPLRRQPEARTVSSALRRRPRSRHGRPETRACRPQTPSSSVGGSGAPRGRRDADAAERPSLRERHPQAGGRWQRSHRARRQTPTHQPSIGASSCSRSAGTSVTGSRQTN